MDDFNKNKPQFLEFNGSRLLIGSYWVHETKIKGALLNLFLRKKASDINLHYGVVQSIESKTGSSNMYTLFGINEEEESLKSLVHGDLIVANNIKKWLPKVGGDERTPANTIFVHSLNTKDVFSEPEFWAVAVDGNGVIQSDLPAISGDRHSLKNALSVYSLVTPPNIVYLNTDGATKSFFKEHHEELFLNLNPSQDFISSNSSSMVFEINEDEFNNAIKEAAPKSIKRIYKPSQLKVKKVGISLGLITGLVCSWFGYSYISQMESTSYFENTVKEEELSSKTRLHADIAKDLKGSSKKWDNESFREETLSQFIKSLNENIYSPMDIALTIREINRTFPVFAAEWRLKDVNYENNRFFISYERIKGGKGVYFLLDELILNTANASNTLDAKSFDLVPEGDVRTYQIIPKIDLPKLNAIQEMEDKLREENKLKKAYARANKKANDSADDLLAKFNEYKTLSFQEKWINRGSNELYSEVEKLESDIAKANRLFKKTKSEFNSFEPLKLERTLTLGNRLDFITMMQLDSFFDWSIPEVVKYYPNLDMLTERNPKKRKGKAPSADSVFLPAIESYTVKITSQNSEEEGKTLSYGVTDIIQLGILINKPFVNVDVVKYDRMTEQWELHLHFHRQTPEYRNRIANSN